MNKSKLISNVKFCTFSIFIILSIFFVLKNKSLLTLKGFEDLTLFISSMGIFAIVVYLVIFTIKPVFVIIPTNIFILMGSILFGPIKGCILSIIGLWLSGSFSFYVAKLLGKDFIDKILGKKLIKLDNKIKKDGFKILFMLRLPPILPYDALSYASGFTDIKYLDFILATVLGVIPETLCYSILGSNCTTPFSWKFIVPMSILLIGTILAKPIMNKIKEKKVSHVS